jgi:hypothetical protein
MSHLTETMATQENELITLLAHLLGVQSIDYSNLSSSLARFDKISYSEAMQRHCLLVEDEEAQLLFVYSDVFDEVLFDWIVE